MYKYPLLQVLIAKDVVTLWKYNKNSKPETKTFTKGTEFVFRFHVNII